MTDLDGMTLRSELHSHRCTDAYSPRDADSPATTGTLIRFAPKLLNVLCLFPATDKTTGVRVALVTVLCSGLRRYATAQ